jgi:hypothetical protein
MKIKNVDPEKFIARMNELLTQHPDFNVEMGLFEASAPGARGTSIRGYDWKDHGLSSMGLHVKIAYKVSQEFGLED